MRRLLLLTFVLIVYGSLYPWHFEFSGSPRHPLLVLLDSWPVVWDRFALRDALLNVLLYFPLGAAACCVLARRFPGTLAFAPAVITGLALSVAMELLQVYTPGRVCSLFDVVCNTAGTAAGAAAALGFGLVKSRHRGPVRVAAFGAWLLLIAFAAYQLYPFFPAVSQSHLHLVWEQLQAPFSWLETWCCGAEWWAAMLLASVALESTTAVLRRLPPPIVLLCLPLRSVVATRTLALHEIAGGALAGLLWLVARGRHRWRIGIGLMAIALLLRELSPFHFSTAPSAFNWIPFQPSLESERLSALVILCRKTFDYGAMVWLLVECGLSYLRSGIVVGASLLVLEAVQRYLPGRTPETTDAVLASLMTLILWTLRNFERRRGLA